MKKIKNFALIASMVLSTSVWADAQSPLVDLTDTLNNSLKAGAATKNIQEMTSLLEERNTDIDIAFQNYLIAKKRVSVARAAFNPITTGHVLGIALGLNYLWAPIAIEAVLSIPTKLYNVSSNKYLEKAALYNSYQAKLAISNEMAHLYYDILTHEVILKSIDKEIDILLYQQESLKLQSRVDMNKAQILSLKMERVDIYNLYVEELAAMKTLLALDPSNELKLAQTATIIEKSFLDGLDTTNLEQFALIKSNEFKRSVNIRHAAESNVKSVQWSILSFSGFNFSYSTRVKEAKIDKTITESEEKSMELQVRNNALIALNNLDSSLTLLENYKSISDVSMGLFNDTFQLYQVGNASQDAAVETSIGAIQDFRSKVVAHYAAWSSLNDFSKATNFNFSYKGEGDNAQAQIEKSPLYGIRTSDFKVALVKDYGRTFSLKIDSEHNEAVLKVTYAFNEVAFPTQTSKRDTKDFISYFTRNENSPNNFSGTATIYLTNGHEFTVDFKF